MVTVTDKLEGLNISMAQKLIDAHKEKRSKSKATTAEITPIYRGSANF